MPKHEIHPGFPDHDRDLVATLYWEAFQGKLGPFMKPQFKAVSFLAPGLCPDFALTARNAKGDLLGVAGFKTSDGAMVGGDLRDLARVYGWVGALWRWAALSLLERDLEPGVLLMDGIFVQENARGMGVGTTLLNAIKQTARDAGLSEVRLDVIDTNPRARALYERQGFVAQKTENIGPLRHLFGFSASTEMRYQL